MVFGPDITWWMWTSCVIIAIMLAVCAVLKLHEAGICPLRDITRLIRRPGFEVVLILFMVGGLVQYGATKGTNGTDRAGQPRRAAPSSAAPGGDLSEALTNEIGQVTSLCFTGIAPLSNSVRLDVAWPTNFFRDGTILDFFAKVGALTNEWSWIGKENALAGTTNVAIEIPYPAGAQIPAAMFFTVRDRYVSAATMSDDDLDGLPGFYELHYGTNPYVADSELVPRITVGMNGDYPTIESALAASTDYSIVDLNGETFEVSKWIVMPSHPVLLEGQRTGYAVLRSSAEIGAVMLTDGQDARTMIRNLIVELRAKRSFQAGFWVGGNTPWTGQGSAATFENVHVRAPYPGVEHFGWLFYRNEAGASRLNGCTMNAAGSTWAYGISMFNAASNVIEDCAFLNMPTNVTENTPIAVLIRNSTNVVVNFQVPEVRSDLSWAGCPLSASYDSAVDSDGDGISDYDEVFTYDTDPWLPDSDGDGIDDGDEIEACTNPKDIVSHPQEFVISVTNTVLYADVTNYVFHGSVADWESNLLLACSEYGCRTNICMDTLFNVSWMGAFRDLNRNGVFDSEVDILRTNNVSGTEAVKTVNFAFGDVDGDGVDDMQERMDGTDPYSPNSLHMRRTVLLVNSDYGAGITNYFNFSEHEDARMDDISGCFVQNTTNFVADLNVTDGGIHLNLFRDFNTNGIYDEGIDIRYHCFINKSTSTSDQVVKIGDYDEDLLPDSVERNDGTDWTNKYSYAYCGRIEISEVFATSNNLQCVGLFGTNVFVGPFTVMNRGVYLSFDRRVAGHGEAVQLRFTDGCCTTAVAVSAKDVRDERCIPLPLGRFDANGNGMLDFWEEQSGLLERSDGGLFDDPDGDGVINLHEYYLRTSPLVSNVVSSVIINCIENIDDRIRGKTMAVKSKFSPYNGTQSRYNQSFWAYDVNTTGASMWNDTGGSTRAGTLISQRHVVFAKHYPIGVGKFLYFAGDDGVIYSNQLAATMFIDGTDIQVGLLAEDVPSVVMPAMLLPTNFSEYISVGRGLPVLQFDYSENGLVLDIDADVSSRLYTGKPRDVTRLRFYENVVTGDSGNPVFLIVDGCPVLLGALHTGRKAVREDVYEGAGCPFLTWHARDVQRVMDDLAPGYSLRFYDFTGFGKLPGYQEVGNDEEN